MITSWLDLSTWLLLLVLLLAAFWLLPWHLAPPMPPGPTQWPLVGCLPQLALFGRTDLLGYLRTLAQRHGGLFTLKFGDFRAVFISDFRLLKEAFVRQGDCFSCRPNIHSITVAHGNPKRKAIVMGDGPDWQVTRRFAVSRLRELSKHSLEARIRSEAQALVRTMTKHSGQPYDPVPVSHRAVINVIVQIIFGERYEYNDERMDELTRSIQGITSSLAVLDMRSMVTILQRLPLNDQYRKLISCQKRFTAILDGQIEKHRNTRRSEEDFIDLCLQMQQEEDAESGIFTDEMISQILGDLFVAGSVTTATTLSWCWLYLAAYPEVQHRCQEEVTQVLGSSPPTMADRQRLPFTEATLCEIQRITTISPLAVMHSTARDTSLGGFRIPRGTWAIPMLSYIHSDPREFPEPQEFRPQRFLDASGKCNKPENFIPYGIGPRACAGESLARTELFLFFVTVLQQLSFSRLSPSSKLDLTPVLGFTQRPRPQDLMITPMGRASG